MKLIQAERGRRQRMREPHLIAAPDMGYHWHLRTVCGICVDGAVYMQAMMAFGEQRVAVRDIGRVECPECLREIDTEKRQ